MYFILLSLDFVEKAWYTKLYDSAQREHLMENQIFISYRRTGGDTTAKLICEPLKNRAFYAKFPKGATP